MAREDWRSASAYEELRPLDAPAFAYQFLRRNPEFNADHARMIRASRKRPLQPAELEDFSRRWGVRFRARQKRRSAVDAPSPSDRGDPDTPSRRAEGL